MVIIGHLNISNLHPPHPSCAQDTLGTEDVYNNATACLKGEGRLDNSFFKNVKSRCAFIKASILQTNKVMWGVEQFFSTGPWSSGNEIASGCQQHLI